jgi:hypothetical protein
MNLVGFARCPRPELQLDRRCGIPCRGSERWKDGDEFVIIFSDHICRSVKACAVHANREMNLRFFQHYDLLLENYIGCLVNRASCE